MARKRANLTDLLNELTFRTTYNKFKLISINDIIWEGLPDGIESRHIEQILYQHGKAVFFQNPVNKKFMVLRAEDAQGVNVYGDPVAYRALGYGYNKLISADDCVIIRNNVLRLPTDDFIMFYVNKITEAERTMDVNIKANKSPVIVSCDDKDELTLKQIFKRVDGNVPVIFPDKSLNMDNMKALDLKAKFLGNELMEYKRSVESDCLTFLGKNNVNYEKRERMITDEANSNNELIVSFADLRMEARLEDAEKIKEKFGITLTPRFRREPMENVMGTMENEEVDNA